MSKVGKILKAIKEDLIPLTEKKVGEGNHVFGGLVMSLSDCSVVTAGSNSRQDNPIYHGEIDTIRRFFALKDRPKPQDCLFVASHAPCSMCVSAIAWSGFREIWVLYGYEAVKDGFDMPVDLLMYKEIFSSDGPSTENCFFKMYDIREEASKEPDYPELKKLIDEIDGLYSAMQVKDFEYPGM